MARRIGRAFVSAAALVAAACGRQDAETDQKPVPYAAAATPDARAAEAASIAEEAYAYGYSLITSEVTRVQMTNVAKAEGLRAPMGQFIHVRRFPPADSRSVSAPNADMLYSVAWLDVGAEPIVFSHPDMGKRFYLFPMYSLWMPVIQSPGSRTTGQQAATYLITGPEWSGEVPAGMTQIQSPTRYLAILGRTYADGSEKDYEIVNALQDQYTLVPLGAYGNSYTFTPPPVDPNPGFSMTDKPRQVIDAMDTASYFDMMARLMGDAAPPAPDDAPIVAMMAKIGLVPGQPFDITKLEPALQAAIAGAPKTSFEKFMAQQRMNANDENGWSVPPATGRYGTNYLGRARIAATGWPATLPEDAVYPITHIDRSGRKLNGANRYTLTFPKGLTPPVDGFWSLTLYADDGGYWLYPNPLGRFTIGLRDNPRFDPDGSLTLYFQHDSPGTAKQANWLPAPAGDFLLMLRMYWPTATPPSILPPGKGTWSPPAVKRVE